MADTRVPTTSPLSADETEEPKLQNQSPLDMLPGDFIDKDEYFRLNNKLDLGEQLRKYVPQNTNFPSPLLGRRNGELTYHKYKYSAFHNTTAIIGSGVLGLPQAISYLGWIGGTVTLVISWIISLYTLHQLVALHEYKGKRFNRYHELGQYAFGKRLGDFAVVLPQLIVMVGLGITYSVTGGTSLYRAWGLICDKAYDLPQEVPDGRCRAAMGQSVWICIFGAIQLLLIQCPDFNALSSVSFLAAVMSLMYSTIAIGGSIKAGKQPDAEYNLDDLSTASSVMNIFNALGVVAFAYGGHNVVLEIQATMPSPPATYKPYMRGVLLAYGVVSWSYFGVAFSGYYAFGNKVQSNVLFSFQKPVWLVVLALFSVSVHMCGSYQVYTMPVLDMIEMQMVKRRIPNGLPTRLVYRTVYVIFTTFAAVSLPFFGDLMGFVGALGIGPTTFWLPPVIWLVLKKPGPKDINFWVSWVCIILGVLVTVVGPIGGLRNIILDARDEMQKVLETAKATQAEEAVEHISHLRDTLHDAEPWGQVIPKPHQGQCWRQTGKQTFTPNKLKKVL